MFLARTNFSMRTNLPLLAILSIVGPFASGAEAVRPMSTDRPDTTESAYTVPAGMFQVEMSFFDYSRDADRGMVSDQWIYAQANLKAGLTQSADLQVIVNSHAIAGESERGDSMRTSGFGDITVRLKQNLWGNDRGSTAFALMPYVTIPTHTRVSGAEWAGGLIAPLSITISDRVVVGLMAQADLVHDSDTNGYDLQWLHSATVGIALTEKLGTYLEIVGIAGEDADYQGIFDAGLTLAVNEALIFDAGVRIGLNRPAPEFGLFTGVSFRF